MDECVAPTTPISVGRAVCIGTLWVNVPVMLIMLGGWGVPLILIAYFARPYGSLIADNVRVSSATAELLLGLRLVGPFVCAWSWWSLNVPKWRPWALQRVAEGPSLERGAILAGLIWDERTGLGRFFARTEIWSRKDRAREAILRRKRGLPPRGAA